MNPNVMPGELAEFNRLKEKVEKHLEWARLDKDELTTEKFRQSEIYVFLAYQCMQEMELMIKRKEEHDREVAKAIVAKHFARGIRIAVVRRGSF
ncbi:hypothetical protein [Aureibacillus halotolerans]|uniref:Uncharacterized protein n=1 Tax=Aureibacillus halotolerans TaxID=1508390 RepID=A0A4R6TUZ0_9BACI|nr:hypothetical protein [Aureibacillus halotolerans]TDQ35240.1 hypothetical protein EV213_12227 [Aureibacillus halotolerans]